MQTVINKSDFELLPYMKSDNLKATFQILNTLVPYIFLWYLAAKIAQSAWFFLLPLIVALLVLFSLRCFSLMHDCGHYSLFSSKKVNRVVGFVLGLVNAIPQYWWSRDHDYHHKTNGDWERYRSIGDFLSTSEFAQLSPADQRLYGMLRHPWMIFPGGFFYLAFKPRLILLDEVWSFGRHLWRTNRHQPRFDLSGAAATYRLKHCKTTREFWDVLLNNIFVVGGWVILCYWLGTRFFLGTYAVVLMFSAAIFICVFFVQHNFPGAYAHGTEGWSYLQGAVEGSSYLEMPQLLKWFTADISYHSIHHLSSRIPNYQLKACHERNAHLLTGVTTIRLADLADCSKLILWDDQNNQLVSIEQFQQQYQESVAG
ncbi:MAG: fatty acid desaturase [Leptolyngbyaceae cyanobacterium]